MSLMLNGPLGIVFQVLWADRKMQGKYNNVLKHWLAWAHREVLRSRLRGLVRWEPLIAAEPGCTAVIGMCSRLPHVMAANLRCLHQSRWPDLKKVVIAVDAVYGPAFDQIEAEARINCPSIDLAFVYYTPEQSAVAEKLKLPFVYCWISWCLALAEVKTSCVLIHDYDALILGLTLRHRYELFVKSRSKMQGVSWYNGSGVVPADRYATTFEAFADTTWLRGMPPIALFNKIRAKGSRSFDFDTMLDAQDQLPVDERTMVPMEASEMVHPSQMIHQYTMFRRHPRRALPCFSVPMIPFFAYVSGHRDAIEHAVSAIEREGKLDVDLLGDGTRFNLSQLDLPQVDWALKQMLQALLGLNQTPDGAIYRYGLALYAVVESSSGRTWRGDFTPPQRRWVDAAATL